MRSTAFRFVLVAGLATSLAPLASDAKPMTTSPTQTTAPSDAVDKAAAGPTPKALTPAARLKRVNAILAKLGLGKVSAVANAEQLTPRNPELENGARIYFAGTIGYEGPSDAAKHGAFRLHYKHQMDYSVLRTLWPTTPGKLYAIDCTANVQYWGGNGRETRPAKMSFKVGDADHVEQTGLGNHVVHAFVAVAATTEVGMEARVQDELPDGQRVYWYGCEVVEAG